MAIINVIEIDFEGEITPVQEVQFDHLPRVHDKIILPTSTGEQNVYKVMDVHHVSGERTTIYIVSDYRSLNGVIQSLAGSID